MNNGILFICLILSIAFVSCKREKNCDGVPTLKPDSTQNISHYYVSTDTIKYLHNQEDTIYATKVESSDNDYIFKVCGEMCVMGGACEDQYKVRHQHIAYRNLQGQQQMLSIDYDYYEKDDGVKPYSLYHFGLYYFSADRDDGAIYQGERIFYDSVEVNRRLYSGVESIYYAIPGEERELFFSSDGKVIKFMLYDTHEMYELIE